MLAHIYVKRWKDVLNVKELLAERVATYARPLVTLGFYRLQEFRM